MLHFKTTYKSKIEKAGRFDARYFYLEDVLQKFNEREDFELIKLGNPKVLKTITDGEHAGQNFVDEGILFIKNSSIKDFDISLNDGFYIEKWKHDEQKRSNLKPKDVLFTTIGHIGSATIVPENFCEANINQNLVKIEIKEEYINPYYVAAYLNSYLIKEQINCLFTGNIHGILTYPKIKNLEIVVPPKEFQNNIANLFKKAIEYTEQSNEIIANAINKFEEYLEIPNEKIDYSKTYSTNRDSLLKNNNWIPKLYLPEYTTTLEEVEKKWETKPLVGKNGVALMYKGDEVGSDNYSKYLEKNDDDVPFIRTSDIYNWQVDQNPDFFIPIEIFNELEQRILENDILFTKDGRIGKTAYVTSEDKLIASSGVSIIRAKNIDPYYLFLVLTSNCIGQFQAIQHTVYASTIPHLRESKISNFRIPILTKEKIEELSKMTKTAMDLKNERKKLIKEIRQTINTYLIS
jgi:type I restriction enzyme S subunit